MKKLLIYFILSLFLITTGCFSMKRTAQSESKSVSRENSNENNKKNEAIPVSNSSSGFIYAYALQDSLVRILGLPYKVCSRDQYSYDYSPENAPGTNGSARIAGEQMKLDAKAASTGTQVSAMEIINCNCKNTFSHDTFINLRNQLIPEVVNVPSRFLTTDQKLYLVRTLWNVIIIEEDLTPELESFLLKFVNDFIGVQVNIFNLPTHKIASALCHVLFAKSFGYGGNSWSHGENQK